MSGVVVDRGDGVGKHVHAIDVGELPQLLAEACVRPKGWRKRDRADHQLPLLVLEVEPGRREEIAEAIAELCKAAEPSPIPHVTVTLSGPSAPGSADASTVDQAAQPRQRTNIRLIREAFERTPWPDARIRRWLHFPRLRLVSRILDFIPYREARRAEAEVRPQPDSHTERTALRDWLAQADAAVRVSQASAEMLDQSKELSQWAKFVAMFAVPFGRILFFLRIHAPVRWIGGPYLWIRTPRTVSLGATTDTSFYTVALQLLGQRYTTPLERFRNYSDLLLMMALLADLRSSFERSLSPWGGWAKTAYPVLTLNGITDNNLGIELLRTINDIRARGPWDPLMIIALVDDRMVYERILRGPGEVAAEIDDGGERPSGGVAHYRDWAARFPGAVPPPGNWFLPMSLTMGVDVRAVRRRRIRTRRRPRWTRPLYQVSAALAAVALAATVVQVSFPNNACTRQRELAPQLVSSVDKECIGIIDNPQIFPDGVADGISLRHILGAIDTSNATAVASGNYVTVLAMGPYSAAPNRTIDADAVLELSGMAIAQDTLNKVGTKPLVRVLTVNAGADMAYQADAVREMVLRAQDDPTVVGVVGLGQNRKDTSSSASSLARAGLPIVATTNSVDSAYGSGFYFHVAPTDYRETQVAVQYLGRNASSLRHGVVVENLDDPYSVELVADIEHNLSASKSASALFGDPVTKVTYETGAGIGDHPNMTRVAQQVCQQVSPPPDFIYYAARATDLPQLLVQLPRYGCAATARPFRVISADDVTNLRQAPPSNVTLDYTTLTFPAIWNDCPHGQGYDFVNAFVNRFPKAGTTALDDGSAIMGNDALATIASAAERVVSDLDPRSRGHVRVTAGEVWRELSNPDTAVYGASGQINVAQAQRIDLAGQPGSEAAKNARDSDKRFVAVLERSTTGSSHMVNYSGFLTTDCPASNVGGRLDQ